MYTSLSQSNNMPTLDFLPATTYTPPSPGQARRRQRSLNTIIEEEQSIRGSIADIDIAESQQVRSPRKADWLSPLSDHFPTPRGIHFMSAPRPASSVDSDNDDTFSPAPSSAPWTRDSYTTEATDFDDLYDASSDEEQKRKRRIRRTSTQKRSSMSSNSSRTSLSSLPALVIPSEGDVWPGVAAYKKLTSPIPPTPPPKVPMSPAIFKYLQSQEVPSSSAPPSLDGSLSSEQFAVMSAPPTPNVGNDDSDGVYDGWGGVQLQPAAMATLQALSGGDDLFEQQTEQVIELSQPQQEMQQVLPPLITNLRRNDSIVLSPEQQRSLNSLSRLEIPSPGGFFSTLSPSTRHTWHLVARTPEDAHPPSSTTAEHFYKTPWSSAPIERIIEVPETASDGIPTARPILTRPELRHESSDETVTGIQSSPVEEEVIPDEILASHAFDYASKLNDTAEANLDRTGLWLAAQSDYLSELINPTEERDDEVALLKRAASTKSQVGLQVTEVNLKENPLPTTELTVPAPRKTVRFSNIVTTSDAIAVPLPSKLERQESAYYRAFQSFTSESRYRDTFVARVPRFEALQAQRVSFGSSHRAHLLGKYQLSVVPMSTKRRLSANVARGDEIAPEDPEKLRRDKEFEARQQMSAANWNVQAIKLLNGGRLIAAPVAKRLARLSSMGPKVDGTPRDRARILDLGGQATCDWAWHCASLYPNTKVYTVTTKSLRQVSNSNIRGPKNHRNVAVDRLTKLPFKDNQFDLISAREIYTVLKSQGENGEDEWESCLSECYRVLKPGGYLEFSIMDSDIVNAGPLGLAKSVEFGYTLKTLGYDPTPSKTFMSRLSSSGFKNVKRAWVFLPMGENQSLKKEREVVRDSTTGEQVKLELEAMVSGSTVDVAAITGVVGAWAWEKWLLRAKVQSEGMEASVEGVQGVVEEGRKCGAGWRTVNGWARKPL